VREIDGRRVGRVLVTAVPAVVVVNPDHPVAGGPGAPEQEAAAEPERAEEQV
jgi:hypothetical protein